MVTKNQMKTNFTSNLLSLLKNKTLKNDSLQYCKTLTSSSFLPLKTARHLLSRTKSSNWTITSGVQNDWLAETPFSTHLKETIHQFSH